MKDQLMADYKEAMKARDNIRKAVITEIRGAIKNKEINEKIEVDEKQIIAIIQKIQKEMNESLEAFEKVGNYDQVIELEGRLTILSTYLPREMDEADLQLLIDTAVLALEEKSMRYMGQVIGTVKAQVESTGYLVNSGKLSGLVKVSLS
ncbi:GatB/YqeY domain-containing protein [Lentisphaera profundi]|uniref:GatB/YqeY domain-containing protein n=1 Tax=Lentisphaera profundi TaxID=1658616 RepID=A0ABY7W2Q9_9BACT|nr:GatB/YqeY domain-containing protein [Lentisphaera profundi]WDE99281.1 GatB/YqeY domain-containing protein [Lentisphaera profundi]